jgi:hypothetical protein
MPTGHSSSMNVKFISIVDKDDTSIPKAAVKSKELKGSEIKFTMEIWCENQHGDKTIVDTAKGLLK